MNSSTTIPFPLTANAAGAPTLPARRRFRWRYLFLGAAAMVFTLMVVLALSFRLGGEVRSLRTAALAAAPDSWERQVEIGIGRLPVLLAKAGLALAPLPPEARAGLSAFESGDVAVYHRRPGSPTPDPVAVFTRVRQAMDRQGWEPLALVREGREVVGVFVPAGQSSSTTLRACVFVMDKSDLVLVSARLNPDPLVALALASMDQVPFLAQR